jgi:hypothetical protein
VKDDQQAGPPCSLRNLRYHSPIQLPRAPLRLPGFNPKPLNTKTLKFFQSARLPPLTAAATAPGAAPG